MPVRSEKAATASAEASARERRKAESLRRDLAARAEEVAAARIALERLRRDLETRVKEIEVERCISNSLRLALAACSDEVADGRRGNEGLRAELAARTNVPDASIGEAPSPAGKVRSALRMTFTMVQSKQGEANI